LALFAPVVVAQPAQAPGPQQVLASGKLPAVNDAPRFFRVLEVTLPAGQRTSVTGAAGMLYQISGSTTVTLAGEMKTLNAGEGFFIPAGAAAQLQAGAGPASTFFHYVLATAAELERPAEANPATAKELYRSPGALPGLKPGTYDMTLQRAAFAPGMAATNPHHRTGGALYYIVSGTAQNTIGGQTTPRGPGSFVYEPYGMVHQWANPSNEPVTRIVFNINPEGTPAVAQGAPAN
jgi:quercetin dioxygenase-like cupin family protein